MPKLVTRAGWGARPPKSRNTVATPHRQAWLHHTGGSESGPAGMRSIQKFHMDNRGWHDIGYSYVYCPKSRTWFEGRGFGVSGAHTPGHNDDLGLCVMGNFDLLKPDAVTVADIRWMLKYAADRGRLAQPRLAGGHRDVKATACPGRHLYAAIGDINTLEDDMKWLKKWPEWAHAWAKKAHAAGVINDDTDPNKKVGDMTVGELLIHLDAAADGVRGKWG